MPEKTIFISHSTANDAQTNLIARALKAAGFGVWVDHLNGIAPGTPSWDKAIRQAIDVADAGIFLMTEASLASEICGSECLLIRELGDPLYVVKLEDVKPTSVWLYIKQIQYADLTRDYDSGIEALINALNGKPTEDSPQALRSNFTEENTLDKPHTMPSKTEKLFIGYRSNDAAKVDKIASDLRLLRYDDGTPHYKTWQDKHDLSPASPYWWDAIVDAIIECRVFVFHLSKASLQSDVCRAELDYAHKRNRPTISVVLEGEFFLNPQSGKYDLPKETWALVPEWLGESQFLFYTGAEFYKGFQTAIGVFERNWPRDIWAPRPLNPDNKSVHGSNHALYEAACDYADRLALAEAEKHFDVLVRRNDADYADVAAQWLELLRMYAELIEIAERRNASFIFKKKWSSYIELYPKEFLAGIFDPKGFTLRKDSESVVPATPAIAALSSPLRYSRPFSSDLMPSPFAWVEIPDKGYSIAKYPITNAQYAKFIDAVGYQESKWWTDAGWQERQKDNWTEPRYWKDAKWNGEKQPVVGISWYESVAFCNWLSDVTGEKILLPNEDQWQYAAQGKDGREYPWGPKWDASRCNNDVDKKGIGKTTPVQQYEGKGDSPLGIVDMVGNVWEWCLTDYVNKTNDMNSAATSRVLRGGSWFDYNSSSFRCDRRGTLSPNGRDDYFGFRVLRA